MNSLLDDDDYERDRKDRELTLSTGSILGIFFGLVLLCGVFFGFGYKIGSHKVMPPVEAATTEDQPAPSTTFSDFKPTAGSPEGGSAALPPSASTSDSSSATTVADNSDDDAASPAAAPVVRERSAAADRTAASAALTPVSAPVATGDIFVQVAAVSHQEDASLLVNALRAKGYPVSARTQPQDKFFHIQVGPFATLKDAQTAKQRLLADGYQPIIK